jgi:hypothetical protein
MFSERDDTWILGSQLNWFRLIPQQESICPLLDITPCPIIWIKSGILEEGDHLGRKKGFSGK